MVYQNPKDRHRLWLSRALATMGVLSAWLFIGWFAWFVIAFPLSGDAFIEGVALLVAMGIPFSIFLLFLLRFAWHRRAATVYSDGLDVPVSPFRGRFRQAPNFVPFTDVAWVYSNPTTFFEGIKIGLRDGTVRGIPPSMLADRLSFLAALRPFVRVVAEDPEVAELLARFDADPERFQDLWFVRKDVWRLEVEVAGIAALATFLAFALATDFRRPLSLVVGLGAIGIAAAISALAV